MYPMFHIGFGAIFAAALYTLFPSTGLTGALFVFIFSFIGDFDHFMVHVMMNKNYSLKKAYAFFTKMAEGINSDKIKQAPLFIFHTIEFIALVVVLSFFWNVLFYAALGLLFHLMLDYAEVKDLKNPDIKCFSIIVCKIKNKQK